MVEKKMMSKPSSLQDVKTGMELSKAYGGIFPEIFKLCLPVVTAMNSGTFF